MFKHRPSDIAEAPVPMASRPTNHWVAFYTEITDCMFAKIKIQSITISRDPCSLFRTQFFLCKRSFGLFSIIPIVFTQAKSKIFAKIYADKYEMVFIFLNFCEILPKKIGTNVRACITWPKWYSKKKNVVHLIHIMISFACRLKQWNVLRWDFHLMVK